MLKMFCFFHILFLCFLGLTGAGQESFEYLNLHDTTQEALQASPHGGLPVAVPVSVHDLGEVSTSILKAESWLRNHVLGHFPSTKITTILVGESALLCQNDQEHNLGLVLSSLKNVYHSLKRWGLEKDIKITAALSSHCLRDDLGEKIIRPLLEFLGATNSSYSVRLPPHLSSSTEETSSFLVSHRDFMRKFGSFEFEKINVIVSSRDEKRRLSRKLFVMESKVIDPYPARPTPLPEISPSSLHSSIGFSVPANVAQTPHPSHHHTTSPPPLSLPVSSPPPLSFPTAPGLPPGFVPASPPFGFSLPPCNPVNSMPPAPEMGMVQKLWCVAKPSVPEETLQEAMDYACGEGGADCAEIMPNGNCFYPDTIVAHASYAFNSYWQNTKRNGGTCSFGGTAMIINADPSFLHCRFVLS
ncbi:hypothetical protein SLEP1_g11784 [Rubroshorea leprosula]|nr:hypothetical protein SLEP1_g11784 [Rubroshorea leprosula]